MVKRRKKGVTKKGTGKGFNERPQKARKIVTCGVKRLVRLFIYFPNSFSGLYRSFHGDQS